MGVDVQTYRSRVGCFPSRRGAGNIPSFVDFNILVKCVGVAFVIRLLLSLFGVEPVPGTMVFSIGIEASPYCVRCFASCSGVGEMTVTLDVCLLVKIIGVVHFIQTLLIIAGIEQNPGPVVPPTINQDIQHQYPMIGASWELNIDIGGDVPDAVKVEKDKIKLSQDDRIRISSCKGSVTISINDVIEEDSGEYKVEVSNAGGYGTSNFNMVVKKYNFRYQYLLVEIGTRVLRKLFDVKVGHDFIRYLAANTNQSRALQLLIKPKKGKPTLTSEQAKLLPPLDNKPNTSNFDITLLSCLLRNVCGLKTPSDVVWTEPLATDLSEEADITRLRHCRNHLSHSGTVLFPATEFTNKWNELKDILLRLNKCCGRDCITDLTTQIDKAKDMDIDDSEIRDRLLKIYEEGCCSLSVTPIYDDDEDKMGLLSIYQPPCLYHVPYHRTQDTENKYSIYSYKEIFSKPDQSFRKIYITGDAGVGKTSFCKRMALLWCKSKCGESVNDKRVQDDIGLMSQFDFVFYISLRETQSKDVITMIIELLGIDEPVMKNEMYKSIGSILRKNKCLIIMDALDEWRPSKSGKINVNKLLSDKCIFVTTCRPYKIENERPSPSEMDRHIQITGIDVDSARRYVTEIVKRMNETNRVMNTPEEFIPKTPEDFIRDVIRCGLSEQLHVPIIASHLVVVWFNHKLTGMSRALIYCTIIDMILKRAEKGKTIDLPDSTESTKFSVLLPEFMSKFFYLKRYTSFLKKICFLSFNILFKQDKCLSDLVFSTEQLESEPYCISVKELDVLCKFGILSKHKVIGQFGTRQQKLSYLHKTYLEFFSALFVCSFDSSEAFVAVVKNLNSVTNIVQFGTFFRFLVGFPCTNNERLFENISHSISDDLSSCRKNAISHYDSDFYLRNLKSLQTMVVNCFKEIRQNDVPNMTCKLEDFIVDDYDDDVDDDDDDDDVVVVDDDDVAVDDDDAVVVDDDDDVAVDDDDAVVVDDDDDDDVADDDVDDAVVVDDDDDDVAVDDVDDDDAVVVDDVDSLFDVDLLKQLLLLNTTCVKSVYSVQGKYYDEFDGMNNLQCLHVGRVLSEGIVKFTKCMLNNQSTLHTVAIEGRIYPPTVLPVEFRVRSLHQLTSLSLCYFRVQHEQLHDLVTFLSDNVHFEHIKLYRVKCDQHLKHHSKLCSLCLYLVCCDQHRDDDSNCRLSMNLKHHSKLCSLYLHQVNISCTDVNKSSIKSVTLWPLSERIAHDYINVFKCLKDSQLEHLDISGRPRYNYRLDDETLRSLTTVVKYLPCLKVLKLGMMKFSSDSLLQLHCDMIPVKIKLVHVTMSRQCFQCFIESCVNKKSVIKVQLVYCTITSVDGDTHRKLSRKDSVDDMYNYLTSIPTVNITDKDDYWFHFETTSCQ